MVSTRVGAPQLSRTVFVVGDLFVATERISCAHHQSEQETVSDRKCCWVAESHLTLFLSLFWKDISAFQI